MPWIVVVNDTPVPIELDNNVAIEARGGVAVVQSELPLVTDAVDEGRLLVIDATINPDTPGIAANIAEALADALALNAQPYPPFPAPPPPSLTQRVATLEALLSGVNVHSCATLADMLALTGLTPGADYAQVADSDGHGHPETFLFYGPGSPSDINSWQAQDVSGIGPEGSLATLLATAEAAAEAYTNAQIATEVAAREAVDALKADLVGGKVPSAQIPAISFVQTHAVANQAAMLALTGVNAGEDLAIRLDGAGTFLLTALPASTLANWTLLPAPTDAVTSVNGHLGPVVLGAADVGAYSTAYVDALAASLAPLASPAFTGHPTGVTEATADSSTRLASTALVDAKLTAGLTDYLPRNSTVPGATTVNGTAAHLVLHGDSTYPAASGLVFKRDDSTFGTGGPGTAYGAAQPIEIYTPSTQLASDTTGDYGGLAGPGANPVIFRVDMFGGVGVPGTGMHVVPGLRQTFGAPDPFAAIWIQLGSGSADAAGLVVSVPPTSSGMVEPAIIVENSTATATLMEVDHAGDVITYAASSVPAAVLYAGTTPPFGVRAVLNASASTVTPLLLAGVSGQSAPLLTGTVNGATKSTIDPGGAFTTYADDGFTPTAVLYPGNAPSFFVRAVLNAHNPTVTPLLLAGATSQTAPLLTATVNAVTKSTIDASGSLITYADNGSTPLGGIYAGNTPEAGAGARAVLLTGGASIAALLLKGAASQTAGLQGNYSSANTLLSGFDAYGDLITYASDGVSAAAAIASGNTPSIAVGSRAQFNTISASLSALALKPVSGQTAHLQVNYDPTGTFAQSAFGNKGSLLTFDDTGATVLGDITTGTTPSGGHRSQLLAGAATITPLALAGAASQTAALLTMKSSAGTLLAAHDAAGDLLAYADDGTTVLAGIYTASTPSSALRAVLKAGAATITPLSLQLAASQTAAALTIKNSSGTQKSNFDATGSWNAFADDGSTGVVSFYTGTAPSFGARAFFHTGASTTGGVVVVGATSQSTDLMEFWNASNAVQSGVNAGGTWVSRTAAGGMVFKDTVTGHYVRYTSVSGSLVGTDIGTSPPTT